MTTEPKQSLALGAKIELTALQLVYLLDDALVTLCLLASMGEEIDTMKIASQKVTELFRCSSMGAEIDTMKIAPQKVTELFRKYRAERENRNF